MDGRAATAATTQQFASSCRRKAGTGTGGGVPWGGACLPWRTCFSGGSSRSSSASRKARCFTSLLQEGRTRGGGVGCGRGGACRSVVKEAGEGDWQVDTAERAIMRLRGAAGWQGTGEAHVQRCACNARLRGQLGQRGHAGVLGWARLVITIFSVFSTLSAASSSAQENTQYSMAGRKDRGPSTTGAWCRRRNISGLRVANYPAGTARWVGGPSSRHPGAQYAKLVRLFPKHRTGTEQPASTAPHTSKPSALPVSIIGAPSHLTIKQRLVAGQPLRRYPFELGLQHAVRGGRIHVEGQCIDVQVFEAGYALGAGAAPGIRAGAEQWILAGAEEG